MDEHEGEVEKTRTGIVCLATGVSALVLGHAVIVPVAAAYGLMVAGGWLRQKVARYQQAIDKQLFPDEE